MNIPTYISTESRAIASYWYASDYHNGMSDWRYLHTCLSSYQPSASESIDDYASNVEVMEAYDWFIKKYE